MPPGEWGGRWDSNPRRPGSQPGALPTELRPPLNGAVSYCNSRVLARPAGLEPATAGLAYHHRFRGPAVASSWPGLSLRHLRRRTYSLYGARRQSAAKRVPFDWLFLGALTLSCLLVELYIPAQTSPAEPSGLRGRPCPWCGAAAPSPQCKPTLGRPAGFHGIAISITC